MLAKKSVCNYFFFQFFCLTFYFENTFVGKNESTRLPISHNFLPYFLKFSQNLITKCKEK